MNTKLKFPLPVIGVSAMIGGCNQEEDQKPNVIIFFADDYGWAQSGAYGSDYYHTPNIDRLAAEGVRFTDAYAAAAISSPTRASLMTGKDPARLNLHCSYPSSMY